MSEQRNPFDELGLDPRHDVRTLTRGLQELAQRATPEEKTRLQKTWRELTQRHADRVRWALLTHPRGLSSNKGIDALRHQVPPSRGELDLDPLVPTLEDALLLPRTLANVNDVVEPPFLNPPCEDQN